MMVYIETDRLILRSATTDDAETLAVGRSSEFVMKYNLYRPCSADQIRDALEYSEYIVMTLRDNGEIIGCFSVKEDDFRYHVNSVSIEAWLTQQYAGQRYMSETVAAMLDYLFCVRMHERVSVRIMEGNVASVRLVEKLGFESEGYLKRGVKRYDDSVLDVYLYSIDRDSYLERYKTRSNT